MSPLPGTLGQSGLPLYATDINALLQAILPLSLAAIERLLPSLLATSGKSGSACSAQHRKHQSPSSFSKAFLVPCRACSL